jgi:hypothetical protein
MTNLIERMWRTSQAWNFERVYKLKTARETHKLRTYIKRDSYDHQCSAYVQRWDGAKWQHVCSRSIAELAAYDIGCYAKNAPKELFHRSASVLESDAKSIVG